MFGVKVCEESPYGAGKGFSLDDLLNTISSCVSKVASAGESIMGYDERRRQIRRTDAQINSDLTGTEKSAREYQFCTGVLLKNALNIAENTPGVYVLCLDGGVMKCGRAVYGQGVAWRLRQYYNLGYDKLSRSGNHWSVNKENRNRVTVSWQCCPACKCDELEAKLFQKYGKGEWAKRAPVYDGSDSWDLLI